jgi:hypothetical protein
LHKVVTSFAGIFPKFCQAASEYRDAKYCDDWLTNFILARRRRIEAGGYAGVRRPAM